VAALLENPNQFAAPQYLALQGWNYRLVIDYSMAEELELEELEKELEKELKELELGLGLGLGLVLGLGLG